VATVPDIYEERLTEIAPGSFKHLRLFALDPYDLALSKLERNTQRDKDDVRHLHSSHVTPEAKQAAIQPAMQAKVSSLSIEGGQNDPFVSRAESGLFSPLFFHPITGPGLQKLKP
jgi:uncharacterized nucleotidyltransferase DUF6036